MRLGSDGAYDISCNLQSSEQMSEEANPRLSLKIAEIFKGIQCAVKANKGHIQHDMASLTSHRKAWAELGKPADILLSMVGPHYLTRFSPGSRR